MKITPWTPNLQNYRATIDGEDVGDNLLCNDASEEEGYIVCAMFTRTPQGGKRMILDEDGEPRCYTCYGRVAITPPRARAGK
jgi:hypothetical protein